MEPHQAAKTEGGAFQPPSALSGPAHPGAGSSGTCVERASCRAAGNSAALTRDQDPGETSQTTEMSRQAAPSYGGPPPPELIFSSICSPFHAEPGSLLNSQLSISAL